MSKLSVIFDMDGTLLDTQKEIIVLWDITGEQMGYGKLGHLVPSCLGMNEEAWTAYLEQNGPENMDVELFKRNFKQYAIDHPSPSVAKPGMYELLDFLDQNKIKYGIASGSDTELVKYRLKELGIDERFAAAIGGDQVQNGKPSPDIFLRTADALGAEYKDCIVFEDSPLGIKAAKSAGMIPIGIPDLVEFDENHISMMLTKLKRLDEAIPIIKSMLSD